MHKSIKHTLGGSQTIHVSTKHTLGGSQTIDVSFKHALGGSHPIHVSSKYALGKCFAIVFFLTIPYNIIFFAKIHSLVH